MLCKVISLCGTANLESRLAVKLQFSNLLDRWANDSMSSKIDFDKSDFKLTGVQDNVVFIENQL